MTILTINGVDFTPFIMSKGYQFTIEDLDASAERTLSGSLVRDRVARIPTIEVTIKPHLDKSVVSRLLVACKPAKIVCHYFNFETGQLETGNFYAKVKSPKIYSIINNKVIYESFTISLKGFESVTYA